jgi:predicted RNase H-like nuclease
MPNSPTLVAGVDGCRKGWIAVVLDDGRFARAELATTFAVLLTRLTDAQVIAVDIPIGLPDGRDPRPADLEAKKLLGPRRSSVFLTPPRPILEAPTYTEANRLSKEKFNRGISAQSYALRTKIFQVDTCAETDDRVFEVHPELSFRAMNGSPLAYSKKNWNGLATRIRLLADQRIVIPNDLDAAGAIPADDVIDAAAAAWSAKRIIDDRADRVGEQIPDGRPNRHAGSIWY